MVCVPAHTLSGDLYGHFLDRFNRFGGLQKPHNPLPSGLCWLGRAGQNLHRLVFWFKFNERGDTLMLSVVTLLNWFTLADDGDGTTELTGIPEEAGQFEVALRVNDAIGAFAEQSFILVVGEAVASRHELYLPLVLKAVL